ncbi:MAG: NAD(P)H-dependent glycerol-3-phosphate dehydrogenase [Bacteroidota bacterium]
MSNLADQPIAMLGAGSWGTALAHSLAVFGGHEVRLWARRPELVETVRRERRNLEYLPNAVLPERVVVTSDIDQAVDGCALVVVATPSQSVRAVAGSVAGALGAEHAVVSVAKGIEIGTLLTTTGVLREVLPAADPDRIGVLYGPSHAEEVGAGKPTTVVVAMPDDAVAHGAQQAFMTDRLRVYVNADLVGVEIAGSVKNVMALAAGMADGVGLGDNAKAALVTRGLAEIKRLGLALGADPLTFAGLAGLGDLIVTCFSRHSRNRYFGEQIGRGRSLGDVEHEMRMVAEGVKTTNSAKALAERHGVEMPITEAVYDILFNHLRPEDAVYELMTRAAKREDALAEVGKG